MAPRSDVSRDPLGPDAQLSSTTLAAFDDIIPIKDLPISHLPAWTFRHRLVELCTAVKGIAFQYIADRFGAERIYYFDPDVGS